MEADNSSELLESIGLAYSYPRGSWLYRFGQHRFSSLAPATFLAISTMMISQSPHRRWKLLPLPATVPQSWADLMARITSLSPDHRGSLCPHKCHRLVLGCSQYFARTARCRD